MIITLTGGTGFIGRRLLDHLRAAGHEVRILCRSPKTGIPPEVELFLWDAMEADPPLESLEGAGAVVHLAGETVAQRWSPEIKRRIRASRVEGTRRLVDALARLERKPAVLVSASATGYYGDRGDEELTEDAAPGSGFLADVCREWEAEARKAAELGIRVVTPRIGMVLGPDGGALAQMVPPFKMFLGGQLGSGRQWMSWIHIEDMVRALAFAVENAGLEGPVNAVAPNPVRNSQFTRMLARTLRRPALFTVPERGLRLLYGDMAEILLASQRVLPRALEKAGFIFRFPELGPALKHLLG